MKFSLAVDALAVAGVLLIGAAAYCYDPRLLLVYAGCAVLLLARFLARIEARKAAPAPAEKAEV